MKILRQFILMSLFLFSLYGISYAQTFKDESLFKISQNSYLSQVYDYKILSILDSFNNYVAKYKITTVKNLQEEGQKREFEIFIYSVSDLKKPKFVINQHCDEIEFKNHYYITKEYGCCTEPTITKLFDYSNQMIIGSSSTVYEIIIPNKELRVFVSYEKSDNYDNFGYINISISHKESYRIKLTWSNALEHPSKVKYPSIVQCPNLIAEPKFDIKKEDKFYDNDLFLFSQEHINSLAQLNLSFSMKFNCDFKHKPIKIDIIKGLPFGKDLKLQEYKITE